MNSTGQDQTPCDRIVMEGYFCKEMVLASTGHLSKKLKIAECINDLCPMSR